jgi:hypothetical protein
MKHDPFEFNIKGMTFADKAWRVLFLVAIIAVLTADLFYWRPM